MPSESIPAPSLSASRTLAQNPATCVPFASYTGTGGGGGGGGSSGGGESVETVLGPGSFTLCSATHWRKLWPVAQPPTASAHPASIKAASNLFMGQATASPPSRHTSPVAYSLVAPGHTSF